MKRTDFLKHLRYKNKLRLSYYKSNKNIYLQLIDDNEEKTLLSLSTFQKDIVNKFQDKFKGRSIANRVNSDWATILSEEFQSKTSNIDKQIIFDVGNFRFGKITNVIFEPINCKNKKSV